MLGDKTSSADDISDIIGIPVEALRTRELSQYMYLVTQKMVWVAGRATTRVEGRVYCLMGLPDINMPLLYGEGEKKAGSQPDPGGDLTYIMKL